MKQVKGFTLLELLVTVAVAALALGLGVPGLHNFYQAQRADAVESRLLRAYRMAREHAIVHHQTVSICGSDDGVHCEGEWSKALVVFRDDDTDGEIDPDEVLEVAQFDLGRAKIKTRMGWGRTEVVIDPDGTTPITGSLVYCPRATASHLHRRVTWNRPGRAYVGVDRNGDGYVDHTDGTPLTC